MKNLSREGHCAAEGCTRVIHARRLCEPHYRETLRPARRVNLCGCGCGERTEYTYKHGHHTRLFPVDEQARRGRCNTGYVKRNQRHEHRRVAEAMVGRALTRDEVVHHRNGNKADNRPENLQVLSRAEHIREHLPDMMEKLRASRRKPA